MGVINIIGNGFDRAHGLETSYGHFIKFLIKESINHNVSVRNELFTVEKLFPEEQTYSYIKENFQKLTKERKISFKNQLLFLMIHNFFDAKWIDIEAFYYKQLNRRGDNISSAKQLNDEFEKIKLYLEKYLTKVSNSSNEYEVEFFNHFKGSLYDNVLFLNFNYTNTLDRYTEFYDSNNINISYEVISIHGELNSNENPIIFGYGDEDHNYDKLLAYDEDVFLNYHKSHIYDSYGNRRKLLNFLNTNSIIEVNVFGHSCGLADRTILRKIFTHKNVTKIKLFYHLKENLDDFMTLSSNVKRIVSDNEIVETRLLDKPDSFPMPQLVF